MTFHAPTTIAPEPLARAPQAVRAARAVAVAVALTLAGGCAGGIASERGATTAGGAGAPTGRPPPIVLGTFEDDYGLRFEITPESWSQEPGATLVVGEWLDEVGSILARADPDGSSSSAGLWTRIDWVALDGMSPWLWGFCLAVWDAPTREAALAAPAADRDHPRTGCNGHPFSRMRRSAEGPTLSRNVPENPAMP